MCWGGGIVWYRLLTFSRGGGGVYTGKFSNYAGVSIAGWSLIITLVYREVIIIFYGN